MKEYTPEDLIWLEEKRSLAEICERFPEEWESIKQELSSQARFNGFNQLLVQTLFFTSKSARKPVSMLLFRLLWPFIWQRKKLMRSVEFKGIYCFYSQEFVKTLAKMIGRKSSLEIAAGDGTLTRFLKAQGTQITAVDNQSWNHSIQYPDTVLRCDAQEALETYTPEIVICSWPPRDNEFERYVFKTPSVETYILISSYLERASGNWVDYQNQTAFSFKADTKLSQLILPPELQPAVYVFQRNRTVNLKAEPLKA